MGVILFQGTSPKTTIGEVPRTKIPTNGATQPKTINGEVTNPKTTIGG